MSHLLPTCSCCPRLSFHLWLLLCCCASMCSSHLPLRLSRAKRRNNTGFYYGLREDDMNFARNSQQILRFRRLDRVSKTSAAAPLRSQDYSTGDREHETFPDISDQIQNFIQKLPSQNVMRSLLSKLQNQQSTQLGHKHNRILASIMTEQNTVHPKLDHQTSNLVLNTTVKSKHKHKRSTKKRRKNNTGFYYGIREDVLVLPEKSTSGKRDMHKKPLDENNSKRKGSKNATDDATITQNEQYPPIIQQQPPEVDRPKVPKMQAPKKEEAKPKNKSKILRKKIILPKDLSTTGIFDETLQELREMKDEIVALREELRSLKGQLKESDDLVSPSLSDEALADEKPKWWYRPTPKEPTVEKPDANEGEVNLPTQTSFDDLEVDESLKHSPRQRRRKFEQVGRDVEAWACQLLFDQENKEEGGWKEIECSKFCRKKFNNDGRTQVFLKWMPDSRNGDDSLNGAESRKSGDEQDYPCIKCYSTIDAPMDKVCSFLSNENTIPVYNELVEDYCDVEEITPHSKITWCKMPQVLFVKSRDFVTYCSHRWWKDGTQVIVNQACEHEDKPGVLVEGKGESCRGYALRGANFISKDPGDPNKTKITLIAHANPGGGLPQWAMNTAVNGVVGIEPFKLFHNINQGVLNYNEPTTSVSPSHQLATVSSLPGRSNKPAGMAQLGYVCFWPNGGGLKEKHSEQNDTVHGDELDY